MIAILKDNPLLLLFLVAAVGYGLGSIKIGKSKLGVAAVLFVGLFMGAVDDALQIPNIVFLLGLSIFVYTIGLSNGPGFFDSFKEKGRKYLLFVSFMQVLSFLMAVGLFFVFGQKATSLAGTYAGSMTNTPALAGILDSIGRIVGNENGASLLEEAVVGYSISYPVGVLGSILVIAIFQKLFKIDYEKEAHSLRTEYPIKSEVTNMTIEVNKEAVRGEMLRDLIEQYEWTVVFGRCKRGEEISLMNWDSRFEIGDLVTVAGSAEELAEVEGILGKRADIELSHDKRVYDTHRVFVSNPDVAGQTIASLNLVEKYQAVISRVRRGDVDLLARGDTVLELGDRIRFVARIKDIPKLFSYFGDSYHALSQIDLLSFGLGMAMGLLLGMISFQLPGDITFKLGFAGGPLIVALILGSLRRTGPIVWSLPYSANLTLRQIGLIFLLASVGVRSGNTFISTIAEGGGGVIFIVGCILTVGSALLTILIGYKFFKIPFSILTGMVSNQPAVVDFAQQQSNNPLPAFGYALSFPIAMILKIIFAQLLYSLLS